jgi:hypothetical protein
MRRAIGRSTCNLDEAYGFAGWVKRSATHQPEKIILGL